MLLPSDPTVDDLREAFHNAPYLSNKHESYFESYAKLLAPYRGKDITFVEVGVFSWGSHFLCGVNSLARKHALSGSSSIQMRSDGVKLALKSLSVVNQTLSFGSHFLRQ